ncbi:CoA pyrophosphatase [Halobacillus salinarum]|uniref:CoA pyrophosphatase n=1 Tax=Halobacillus salinarum TaxID=2932257 RepID=A0ABY4EKD0_9BACI|nr:CoA pyrophosphatase [Halobacillus salinarum]UOQ44934.1 CoA pyrophosphatase [Halobacillus salinarum]
MDQETIFNKVKNHTPTILGSRQFAKFAILVPLIERDGETHVLFEVRSHKMRRQPGEICFPGGKIEPHDPSEKEAAIRETKEELGLNDEDITDALPIDYLVSPFGMIVYPFAGQIHTSFSSLKPNPKEVSEAFTVPLSFFLTNEPVVHYVDFQARPRDDFPYEMVPGGENYNWRPRQIEEYFYLYEDKSIWGLTAKVLSHFIDVIR